jgi:DNA-binding CsgD family transcriptional regulator
VKKAAIYAAAGGVLIALLKWIEYDYLVRAYPGEIYGGIVAIIFTAVGIHVGLRLTRAKEVVVVKEVPVEVHVERAPFAFDPAKAKDVGITPREHEILTLIAEGLSNREIGERLFVSENTVKTHSSRIFDKLGVARRVQAVVRARELGLIP